MSKTPVLFFVLFREGARWEYHFHCPRCEKALEIPAAVSPDCIECPFCRAVLDASGARVELETRAMGHAA